MTRTLTPSVSIWSAIVWNWAGSPWAFWMAVLTPAASNAAFRKGLSAGSQRAEDLVSGRMTPTNGVLALPLAPELAVPSDLPHADRPPATTSPAAAKARIPLRICTGPFGVCAARGGGRVVLFGCFVRVSPGLCGAG